MLILRFSAPDQPGLVAQVAALLAAQGCDIRAAAVFGDPDTARFFCRMELASALDADSLAAAFAQTAATLALDSSIRDAATPMRVLIAVSRQGHCLTDLIHKTQTGQLPIAIVGVVSNHDDLRAATQWHRLPFHHLPMTDGKAAQEARLLALVRDTGAELVVLARYMQVLSDGAATALAGRCLNIHHGFLPSFKGARPYHQAHDRGVKLIGATAHFVTADLDEGPIVEQDVRRVDHATTADDMIAIGRETEASVLARAVRWYAEHRVFLDGQRTVIL